MARYKAQLPPGWQGESVADLNQVRQGFTAQNIGKMLAPPATAGPGTRPRRRP